MITLIELKEFMEEELERGVDLSEAKAFMNFLEIDRYDWLKGNLKEKERRLIWKKFLKTEWKGLSKSL